MRIRMQFAMRFRMGRWLDDGDGARGRSGFAFGCGCFSPEEEQGQGFPFETGMAAPVTGGQPWEATRAKSAVVASATGE
ncbi:MAG: hypothetical protein HUU14_12405 [Dehalococcoidia bacterium]|nr:hypothetical protein [Dehalococcoidia bacterium]